MKNQNPAVNDPLILYAPVSGVIMPIETVPDPAFSGKMVGDGIAMDPASEVLLAPCGGTVTHSLPHALTLTTPEGVDVLLHIGLDTVQLKGAGFSAKVQKG
ncbi:PTS glucose transporter subunit IIA, partial [Desulfosarcina sp. OttesenSCG-928-B08]|nr:PTS glucose transporter subunit IIA [Desulfosarcina sp. OttesenSCG-928-B08]